MELNSLPVIFTLNYSSLNSSNIISTGKQSRNDKEVCRDLEPANYRNQTAISTLYKAFCVIWYHLCNLKNLQKIHDGVFLLV